MAPPVSELVTAAHAIVAEARTSGILHEITKKKVRRQIEADLHLEEGALDAFKGEISKAVDAAISESDKENALGTTPKKAKVNVVNVPQSTEKKGGKKRKSEATDDEVTKKIEGVDGKVTRTTSTARARAKKSGEDVHDESAEPEWTRGKKRKSDATDDEAVKKAKPSAGKPKAVKKRTQKNPVKIVVESEPSEDDVSSNKQLPPTKQISKKTAQDKSLVENKENDEIDGKVERTKTASVPSRNDKDTPNIPRTERTPINEESLLSSLTEDSTGAPAKGADIVSDTELSSVYDEPPQKRGKGKGRAKKSLDDDDKVAKKTKVEKVKRPTKPEDKDEEMIKKLKSLIVACGVRKVWTKELASCDTPREQIAHLKRLLADLGMDGRMTLEKAKEIKAKREFAKELEDVVEYEKMMGASAVGARQAAEEANAKMAEVGGEEDDPAVIWKKRNQELFGFIGDQSSDED